MNAPRPKIVLNRHFFTRLAVTANPMFDATTSPVKTADLVANLDISQPPDTKGTLMCTQTLRLEATSAVPYALDVECVGFFRAADPVELTDEQLHMASIVAHQVLYAAVREMVLTMSARMAWGPFSIGLATLDDATREEGTAASAKDAGPPPGKPRRKKETAKAT